MKQVVLTKGKHPDKVRHLEVVLFVASHAARCRQHLRGHQYMLTSGCPAHILTKRVPGTLEPLSRKKFLARSSAHSKEGTVQDLTTLSPCWFFHCRCRFLLDLLCHSFCFCFCFCFAFRCRCFSLRFPFSFWFGRST